MHRSTHAALVGFQSWVLSFAEGVEIREIPSEFPNVVNVGTFTSMLVIEMSITTLLKCLLHFKTLKGAK